MATSNETKARTYFELNPDLSVHEMYGYRFDIPEYQRIATTKFRLSSHWLAIETGRWSRKRREDRLCTCGEIQTEKHVITQCGRTEHIRAAYPNLDWVGWPNLLL